MNNILFLKYFVINYILNFMYIYNIQWKISPKWKYDFMRAINCTRKLTWLCACACGCDCTCLKEQYVDFSESDLRKREKKKKHFITNISISYGSQTYWSFMKFYFVHMVKVCFVFKRQSLCLYSSVRVRVRVRVRKNNCRLNFTKNCQAS